MKKVLLLIITLSIFCISSNLSVKAEESSSVIEGDNITSTFENSAELLSAYDYYKMLYLEEKITDYDFESICLILSSFVLNKELRVSGSEYYPERLVGRIDYKGVKYLYEEGLRNAKTIEAIFSGLMGLSNVGWGISAVGLAATVGGRSQLESAVNKAYFQKKGIDVYYKIHKSIMSLNTTRYVVR